MMHFAVIYCRIGLWRHHFKDGGYGYFLELRNSEKKISPETSWSTKDCVIDAYLACEQALLFGRAKRAAREGASERRMREGPAVASPLACLSRVYFSRYPPNGELARRLMLIILNDC